LASCELRYEYVVIVYLLIDISTGWSENNGNETNIKKTLSTIFLLGKGVNGVG